ncbi:thyroid adenoma-associated protein [Plakobranchus ocellatus]|uniref:Thyroid adenoma-associated protein n=1 Tax=Plakobranchus ocellatus TaxID=259542 RepID=A0AAV4CNP1_9GAST|nr:thyroid adenoma-associated protein [Plakobranchus ocellatus]
MKGDSKAMQSLLGYVWTNWEDQLDIVRQSAKVVFEKVLQIHCIVIKAEYDEGGESTSNLFIKSLMQHLLILNWSSRGKFSALTSCVRHVGYYPFLEAKPCLPEEVIQQLQEQAMSCYASELYCALLSSHKEELGLGDLQPVVRNTSSLIGKQKDETVQVLENPESSEDTTLLQTPQNEFLKTWIQPVTKAMCSSNKKLVQNIVEVCTAGNFFLLFENSIIFKNVCH